MDALLILGLILAFALWLLVLWALRPTPSRSYRSLADEWQTEALRTLALARAQSQEIQLLRHRLGMIGNLVDRHTEVVRVVRADWPGVPWSTLSELLHEIDKQTGRRRHDGVRPTTAGERTQEGVE